MDAVDPPFLIDYGQKILDLAALYGEVCWPVLYQAEFRFRREAMDRYKRAESRKYTRLAAKGRVRPGYRRCRLGFRWIPGAHTPVAFPEAAGAARTWSKGGGGAGSVGLTDEPRRGWAVFVAPPPMLPRCGVRGVWGMRVGYCAARAHGLATTRGVYPVHRVPQ